MSKMIFPLAILKGIIEHDDGTAYFGSLGGYLEHKRQAIELGWIEDDEPECHITLLGHDIYVRCKLSDLPTKRLSRAYMWNWKEENIP